MWTEKRRFYLELNYQIPAQLKKAGFEIIRPEAKSGINERMIGRIARAIHSRYMHEMRKQISGKIKSTSAGENGKMTTPDDPGSTDFD